MRKLTLTEATKWLRDLAENIKMRNECVAEGKFPEADDFETEIEAGKKRMVLFIPDEAFVELFKSTLGMK